MMVCISCVETRFTSYHQIEDRVCMCTDVPIVRVALHFITFFLLSFFIAFAYFNARSLVTFKRNERLSSQKQNEKLFEKNSEFKVKGRRTIKQRKKENENEIEAKRTGKKNSQNYVYSLWKAFAALKKKNKKKKNGQRGMEKAEEFLQLHEK